MVVIDVFRAGEGFQVVFADRGELFVGPLERMPLEAMRAWLERQEQVGLGGPVTPDPQVVAMLLRGQRREDRLGELTVAVVLAAAAAAAIARYGPGVVEWVVDGVESFLGINTCSDANKRKHRERIEALISSGPEGIRAIADGLAAGEMTGATGECLKYALQWAAKRVMELSKAEGLPLEAVKSVADRRADIRREVSGTFQSREACSLRIARLRRDDRAVGREADVWTTAFAAEMAALCQNLRPSAPSCTAPPEVRLVGFDDDAYCAMGADERAMLRDQVQAAALTKAERAELLGLPMAQRHARFLAIVGTRQTHASPPIESDDSGLGWGVALLTIGTIGGGWWLIKRSASKGRR